MPPSQNPEVKEISQRMAHLHALLDMAKPHEIKPLWFEYRDLRERRKLIEAGEATAGEAPTGETTAGQTTAEEPSDTNDVSINTQGAKGSSKPGKSVKIHDDKRSSSPAARGESETDE